MGRRNRERIEHILNGEETAIRDGGGDARQLGVSEKVVRKVEETTRKIIEKTMVPKWTGMSLPQQVRVARGVLRMQGVVSFRSNFLKPANFPDDIKDKVKAGWDNDQIKAYYLGCPEFLEFWGDLGLTEDNFETLLPIPKSAVTPSGADATKSSVLIPQTNSGGCKGAKPPAVPSIDTGKLPWYRKVLAAVTHK